MLTKFKYLASIEQAVNNQHDKAAFQLLHNAAFTASISCKDKWYCNG